jgi:hypothetical protein
MRRRIGFGVSYVLLGALGVAMLLHDAWSDVTRSVATLFGALLVIVAVAGLVLVSFIPWFDRHRPDPTLATAPSGAPATFFRRSPFVTVMSVLVCLALAGWLVAAAVAFHGHGEDAWALAAAALALVLLWPVAVAATGRVKAGGLWLTRSGVEHRKEAVSWSVLWSDPRGVEDQAAAAALPYSFGRGVRPVHPVVLVLHSDARPAVRRTVRWIWNREGAGPAGSLCVDSYDLAGGRSTITELIERCLTQPQMREQLGTSGSVPRRAG